MFKRKISLLVVFAAVLVVLGGCRLSKADYEKKVKSILTRSETKIDQISRDYQPRSTCLPSPRIEIKRNNQLIKIFSGLEKELIDLSPPKEYEKGHQALLEQVRLTLDALKLSQQILQGRIDGTDVTELEKKLDRMAGKFQTYVAKIDREFPFTRSILRTPE